LLFYDEPKARTGQEYVFNDIIKHATVAGCFLTLRTGQALILARNRRELAGKSDIFIAKLSGDNDLTITDIERSKTYARISSHLIHRSTPSCDD